ncbi:TrkH family potassium uptake protein [Ruminococcus sp. OA3]|uniref:TrkH family potassium uptake protein n=1 Tax=Ruminococcus sp. OA3 TaxID=2914164 RepID=UPI001F05845C|nr:TrkH family potassium uptake protein [Ruminococcus sp. OA3]MCH1981822.1 TrkH family potassium uptake protein [Ruminococcus sp. OA3]
MNYSMIRYILGIVLKVEGLFMLLPCLVAVIYREKSGFSFVAVVLLCMAAGFLLSHKKPSNTVFYAKEGFLCVSLSWVFLSVFGALPFILSGEIPSVTDALFEAISGFTTTGASILTDVEALSHCILFWRSFTHWIGGMGVLVFILAIIPMAGGHRMYLMKAESPGPTVEKLVPRVKNTAMILYGIYTLMTIAEIIILIICGMPVFDSFCISFGAAGTGGFGIRNDSLASYAPHLQVLVTLFMIAFGVNFNIYYLILCKKFRQAFRSEELRAYLGVILATILIITWNIHTRFGNIWEALRHSAFQVGSIITTTGFSTDNFDIWPQLSKTLLIMLMFLGACAGSTGGGIKVSRFLIMLKTVRKELFSFCHPHGIRKIKMDGHLVAHETVRAVNIFLIAYMLIMAFSILLIGFDNYDFTTNFTAVTATLNNIGPGLELVGPMENFNLFSPFSKFILMFDMLAGRLEIFPILMLMNPSTWRRS